MGIMDKLGGTVLQGMLGNMSEISTEKLMQDYGAYLIDGETIKTGFILIRDVVIFSDSRASFLMTFVQSGMPPRLPAHDLCMLSHDISA